MERIYVPPLTMPKIAERVEVESLDAQMVALVAQRETLEKVRDGLADKVLEASKGDKAANRSAEKAWGLVRQKAKLIDIGLGAILPGLLGVMVAALIISLPTVGSIWGRIGLGVFVAAMVAGGQYKFWAGKATKLQYIYLNIPIALMIGIGFNWGALLLGILAIGAQIGFRLARPGTLGRMPVGVPLDGLFRSAKGQTHLFMKGEEEALPMKERDLEGKRGLVVKLDGNRWVWTIPSLGKSGFVGRADWMTKMLPGLIEDSRVLTDWANRDMNKLAKAEKLLKEQEDELARLKARLDAMERQSRAWDGMGLPGPVVSQLATAASLIIASDPSAPTGILLHGPAGTGKTEIGNRIARAGGMTFLSTSASALKSEHVGGTEKKVADLFWLAKERAPSIIFVDECDSCLPDRGGTADSFAKSITESFLTHWQGVDGAGRICVVGATNHRSRIDPAIMSRFSDAIEIGPPDINARRVILSKAFHEAGLKIPVPENMVVQTAGSVGRDLMTLAKSVRRDMLALNSEILTDDILAKSFNSLRSRGSSGVEQSATWENLILPEDVLTDLKTMTRMISASEVLKAQGIRVPRGILLEGPPGTGKTQIARTMANMSGLTFIPLSPSDLKGGFVGQTAGMVKNAMARARGQAPSIVFFDEIDTIAPARGSGDSFTQDLIGQLLQELDGALKDDRPVFFLAATNRVETLDAAVRSRFPRTLTVPLPEKNAREGILGMLLARVLHVQEERGWIASEVAAHTDAYSGRDLRSLLEQATIQAFNRSEDASHVVISLADFAKALKERK